MVLFTRAPAPHPGLHNGTLLTGGHTGTGPTWSCMGSAPDQAGTYHCKAWNDAGPRRSGTARTYGGLVSILGTLP